MSCSFLDAISLAIAVVIVIQIIAGPNVQISKIAMRQYGQKYKPTVPEHFGDVASLSCINVPGSKGVRNTDQTSLRSQRTTASSNR